MENLAQQEAEDNVKQRRKSDEASKDGKSSPEIEKVTEVPRTIGLAGGISFIVGTIVGSGIFVSPRGVALNSGSVGMTLVVWFVSGIISLIGALCYAELGTVIKLSGADYTYLDKAYGALVSFQYSWVSSILVRPGQMAAIALTLAEYLMALFFLDGCGVAPDVINKLLATVVLLILGAINVSSATLANRIQVVFTVAKLLALVVIIVGGVVKLFQGHTEHLATGFQGTETGIGVLMTGFYSGMWAYDGWNTANFMTEEIINPERNLPLSIMIGVPLVIFLFVLTNVSYFTVLSVPQIVHSNAVALSWSAQVIPGFVWFIPVAVALTCFGTLNGYLFSSGRLMYAAARNSHFPSIFSMVHARRFTPSPAILLNVICSIVLAFIADVPSLIDLLGFLLWLFYGLNIFAVIVCRFNKYKDTPRPFKVPLVLPVIAGIFSVVLVLVPLVVNPQLGYFFSLAFILLGYAFYLLFVHLKLKLPCMRALTKAGQLLMVVYRVDSHDS